MKNSAFILIVKILVAIALIVSGICAFLVSDYSESTGSLKTESDSSYGGDAYTGIQNAGAQAATNAYYIYKRIDDFASKTLRLAGIVVFSIGMEKLLVTVYSAYKG